MRIINHGIDCIDRGAAALMEECGKLVDTHELRRAEEAAEAARQATRAVE